MVWLVAGLAVLIVEGVSWALAGLAERFFSTPVPLRGAFLAEQSTRLARLASNQSVRANIHPVLGWGYGTGPVSATEHLNAQGLRAAREYTPEPPPGLRRIAAFGDSYVYCNEVTDAESWPGQIEAGWRAEVLNYGVGGYGADQAFLRFRDEGAQLRPQVVLIGFTTMMAPRMVSRYRRFQDPGDGPWFKPRFILEGDTLRFLPAPVASREDADRLLANPAGVTAYGRHDFWYHPAVFEHRLYRWSAAYRLLACVGRAVRLRYWHPDRLYRDGVLNPQAEAFAVLTAVFRDFVAAVRALGAQPAALLLPERSDVELYVRRGRASYDSLRTRLTQLDLAVIDPVIALTSSPGPVADLFAAGGHYSATGNAVVARAVADALQLGRR